MGRQVPTPKACGWDCLRLPNPILNVGLRHWLVPANGTHAVDWRTPSRSFADVCVFCFCLFSLLLSSAVFQSFLGLVEEAFQLTIGKRALSSEFKCICVFVSFAFNFTFFGCRRGIPSTSRLKCIVKLICLCLCFSLICFHFHFLQHSSQQ